MANEELKACPFCGSDAESLFELFKLNTIRCTNKDCPGSQTGFHEHGGIDVAIAAWNHRQPDTALADALQDILATTSVEGYAKVMEIANAAVAKHEEQYKGELKKFHKQLPIEDAFSESPDTELVKAFFKYARHTSSCCRMLHSLNTVCDCGLDEATVKYRSKD